ncbi:MAG TPA: hypothetical protein VEB21_04055 [Terriglobales bacterium]|nr:hypothetical protein [Terriglobales bacterium]
MKPARTILTLLLAHLLMVGVTGGSLGCGSGDGDDDENIGRLRPGESEEVELNVFVADPIFLDECEDAFIVDINGPDGDASDVIDAEITDFVSKTARGECETDVTITVGEDAPAGRYEIEVEFLYELIDDDEEEESGFIEFRVVR